MQDKSLQLCIVLLVISFFLFVLDRGGALTGVRLVVQRLGIPVEVSINSYANSMFKNQIVEELRNQNQELEAKLSKLTDVEKENTDLRNQLNTPLSSKPSLLPAQVLSTTYAYIIDKGSNDRVTEGMMVVYKDIYIGKIVKVQATTSRVLLPTDKESIIEARTVETNARGLVNGQTSAMTLTEVLPTEKLDKDDTVVTLGSLNENGLGVSPGMVIGKVDTVRKSDNSLFQEAKVTPVVNYKALNTVFIVYK